MKTGFRIAVAQLDCRVGDLTGNVDRIARAAQAALGEGADLLITPELALCGYPPEDLLLWGDFRFACTRELLRLAGLCRGIDVLVGTPHWEEGVRYNAAVLLRDGRVEAIYRKVRLPNHEVFDELRYFVSGEQTCVIQIRGVAVGINICADIWEPEVVEAASRAGAEVLLVLNASPYHIGKQARRLDVIRQRVRATGMAMLYCNLVGGQGDLVFDGASFAINPEGGLAYQAPAFEERIDYLDYAEGEFVTAALAPRTSLEAEVYKALVLGLRDYLAKTGSPGAVLGLSGTLDSLLTLCIAVDAVGPAGVRAILLPAGGPREAGRAGARQAALALGVVCEEWPHAEAISSRMAEDMFLTVQESPSGWCVLACACKSTMAIGEIRSLGWHGDFAVLKDVPAGLVRRLAAWRNRSSAIIPADWLPAEGARSPVEAGAPSEATVDAILQAFMEYRESPREIIAHGYRGEDVRWVLDRLHRAERWRRLIPPGVRITRCSFGREWRYPLASGYVDEY